MTRVRKLPSSITITNCYVTIFYWISIVNTLLKMKMSIWKEICSGIYFVSPLNLLIFSRPEFNFVCNTVSQICVCSLQRWDPSRPPPTMADFDKKLTESDGYLQLLIDQARQVITHSYYLCCLCNLISNNILGTLGVSSINWKVFYCILLSSLFWK